MKTSIFAAILISRSELSSSLSMNYRNSRRSEMTKLFVAHDMEKPKESARDDLFITQSEKFVVPDVVENDVLKQVYGAMLLHRQEFGNPNIPLGTVEGKKCKTIRSLYQKKKLTDGEVELLMKIGFNFSDLENVYHEADFDDIVRRLKKYKEENPENGMQIPKKYKRDPELGAWVTMARRLGPNGVGDERREILDEIGFAWKSTRKCGSVFMKNFRQIREKLEQQYVETLTGIETGCCGAEVIKSDPELAKWLSAQKEAHKFGKISEARIKYLEQLKSFGVDWLEFS